MPSGRAQRLWTAVSRRLTDGGEGLPTLALLVLLCAASATTLVILGTRLTFFNDDWYSLLQRPGITADTLFTPHNEHPVVLPLLIYKGLVALFGFDAQVPFRLVLAATVISLGVLVFFFVRERAGPLLALLAAALLLFLGPAAEDLLWSFQIGLIGSLTTGVGMLLALERDTPLRNVVACLLAVASIALSGLGVSFVAAAAVAVLLRRRPFELWIAAVPAVLFAIWWLIYGSDAPSAVSAGNIARTPVYVLDAIAAGLASLTGLTQATSGDLEPHYAWGRPLLALVVAGIAIWLYRGGRPSRYLLVVGTAALSAWVLAAIDVKPGRSPIAGRYQLVWGTFIILLAAELFRPVRLRPPLLAAVTALAVVAIGANLGSLNSGYEFFRHESDLTRADLGALELGRAHIPPEFQLLEPVARSDYLTGVTAGAYFREIDQHGSPADSPAEIAARPPEIRQAADNVLAAGYALALAPAASPAAGADCTKVPAELGGGDRSLELTNGRTVITNLGGPPVTVAVRRFAPPGFVIELGMLAGGFSTSFSIPTDAVALPWHLEVSGESDLDVCRI